MRLKVVAFFTPNYADDATRLRLSLEELNVPHRVVPITLADPSWKTAVLYKTNFIAEEMCALGAEYDGLVYTDADSILRRPMPLEALADCDLGMTRFRWSAGHAWELLSGTIFFRRCPVVYALVNDWHKATPKFKHTDTPEQRSMEEVLEKHKAVRFVALSQEWCSIFDAPRPQGHRPIFEHYQASRTKRK